MLKAKNMAERLAVATIHQRSRVGLKLSSETPITLAEVPSYIPKRNGRKVHYSTIYRWITKGTRGRVLESSLVGGIRYTTVEAVQRFVGATSPPIITPSDELDVVNQALEEAGL